MSCEQCSEARALGNRFCIKCGADTYAQSGADAYPHSKNNTQAYVPQPVGAATYAPEPVGAATAAGPGAAPWSAYPAVQPAQPSGPLPAYAASRHCPRCAALVQAHTPFCGMCGALVDQQAGAYAVQPPYATPAYAQAPGQVRYAGFWLRLVAMALDSALVLIVTFVVAVIALGIMGTTSVRQPSSDTAGSVMYITLAAVSWLYYTIMEASARQATLGKMALRLRVTDENGGRISFARANGRFWGKILSSFFCYAGFIMAACTQRKQALHDRLSGCLVVAVRR